MHTALAQYVWLDEKGVRQYSDQPPPASVPNSHILKQPGAVVQPAVSAMSSNEQASTAGAATSQAPMTMEEREADFRRRRAEQAEKEKKVAEEARQAANRKKNCQRARAYHQALASGERISRTGDNGERSFLTDEQRERELRETRAVLNECK
jgi:hypothetical protein